MGDDQNWAKLVSYLYNSETGRLQAPLYEPYDPRGLNSNHEFVNKLNLDRKDAADALFQVVEFGLIELTYEGTETIGPSELEFNMFEENNPDRNYPLHMYAVGLSEKGFDVAHQRAIQNRQEKKEEEFRSFQKINNLLVMMFTVILGVSASIQAILAYHDASASVP